MAGWPDDTQSYKGELALCEQALCAIVADHREWFHEALWSKIREQTPSGSRLPNRAIAENLVDSIADRTTPSLPSRWWIIRKLKRAFAREKVYFAGTENIALGLVIILGLFVLQDHGILEWKFLDNSRAFLKRSLDYVIGGVPSHLQRLIDSSHSSNEILSTIPNTTYWHIGTALSILILSVMRLVRVVTETNHRFINNVKLSIAFWISVLSLILVILGYAEIYEAVGLIDTQGKTSPTHDPVDCLYFSVVTWTTLGYGDLLPPAPLRLVAASEAAVGYISMALFLAGLISKAGRRVRK